MSCNNEQGNYDIPNAMQITVCIRRTIIVNDDIYSFDVNTTTKDIRGDKDTFFKSLECRITTDTETDILTQENP
jgi:hypothetical protein